MLDYINSLAVRTIVHKCKSSHGSNCIEIPIF
jgi:hypothetical protein